ncbi:Calx-beta domain-containing protein [Kribbella catacumbae]|uniref:Calx-beta domain-containing protein n=1 Tax=Kribbella catacumbae TaxID=460086 RepID=UPI00036ADD77|nr:Calx-beta domain-containing protein [Kribbella catacumbae]
MRVFGRAGLVVALLGAALLAPAGQAQAAPPDQPVAKGKNWEIHPEAGGYRVTLHLGAPAPMRGALPLIAVNGKPVGVAKQSPDRRTVSVVTTDPSVPAAKDVQLVWSGDLARNQGKKGKSQAGGVTTDKEWLKAPLGPPLAVDPGATGKYAVETAEYNLGDQVVLLPGLGQKAEVLGKVYSPRGALGPRPLVVFLHGRHAVCYGDPTEEPTAPWPCAKGEKPIPSYRGYDGPAKALARNGYQVVSISANAVNAFDDGVYDQGAQARAELILDHLALWKKWSTVGGGPFGSRFVGKLDLQNIGLMGHSRGGEGVARAAVLNAGRGGQYGIRAVLPLAPTDFARATVPGVAMSVILPYCDGDVSDLQGQKFYDDTRYAVTRDAAARSTVTILGANHNFFNTEWTPGQSVAPSNDDWWGEDDKAAPCGAKYAGRLTAKEQQAVGTAYVAGFFRLQLGQETKLLPLLDGSNAHPASAGRAVVRVVSQAPEASRRDVNRLDQALPAGAVTGSVKATVCAGTDEASRAQPATCVKTGNSWDSPHWVEAWFAQHTPTTAVTKLTWTGRNGVVRINLGATQRDVRRYSVLTFRATPDPSGAPKTDLTVRVVDGKGRAAAVPVSAVSDALLRMPGAPGLGLPKNLLRTVRIPTNSLKGINLRDVRAIELVTDKVASGSVFVSDLAFSTPGLGKSAPSRLVRVSASNVGKVQEGNSGTKNVDFWVTLSRPSPRPVSVYAESSGDLGNSVGSVVKHLVFRPGQTKQKITVPITGNTRDSYDLVFSLVLSAPQEALLGQSFGNAEVIDDDPTPTLTAGPAKAAENAGLLKFPLKLSAPSDKFIWLDGELKDGTAVIRKDFTTLEDDGTSNPPDRAVYGQLEPGRTTANIEVKLVDDKVKEATETFTVGLTSVEGADFKLPATLTGTITDND